MINKRLYDKTFCDEHQEYKPCIYCEHKRVEQENAEPRKQFATRKDLKSKREIISELLEMEKQGRKELSIHYFIDLLDYVETYYDENFELRKLLKTINGGWEDERKENQELKQQLANAIVPKFKIGQEVWRADDLHKTITKEIVASIEVSRFWEGTAYLLSAVDTTGCQRYTEKVIFPTQTEALAALEALKAGGK